MAKPSRATLLRHFPYSGPCGVCKLWSSCGLTARHRIIDAIRSRYKAGESIRFLAIDYTLPRAVVQYVATAPLKELDFLRRNKS